MIVRAVQVVHDVVNFRAIPFHADDSPAVFDLSSELVYGAYASCFANVYYARVTGSAVVLVEQATPFGIGPLGAITYSKSCANCEGCEHRSSSNDQTSALFEKPSVGVTMCGHCRFPWCQWAVFREDRKGRSTVLGFEQAVIR